ncbi:MAG: GNAT family N-acetyltransferase, partial [Clostridiales bacterium]|nr:GNAT family N-acetyltransferase [Clostridiales bacterium]
EAEILGIAVKESLRKKGIGKDMVYQVMEAESLKKNTAQTDDDAIRFYRRSGFEAERIVIEYPDGSAVRYNCVLYN